MQGSIKGRRFNFGCASGRLNGIKFNTHTHTKKAIITSFYFRIVNRINNRWRPMQMIIDWSPVVVCLATGTWREKHSFRIWSIDWKSISINYKLINVTHYMTSRTMKTLPHSPSGKKKKAF